MQNSSGAYGGGGMMNMSAGVDGFSSNGAMFYPNAHMAPQAMMQQAIMQQQMMPVQLPAHLSLINPANFNPETAATGGSRFFVMKTFSEDDIHRSIKYGVWSGADQGNRRLSAVWRDIARGYNNVKGSSSSNGKASQSSSAKEGGAAAAAAGVASGGGGATPKEASGGRNKKGKRGKGTKGGDARGSSSSSGGAGAGVAVVVGGDNGKASGGAKTEEEGVEKGRKEKEACPKKEGGSKDAVETGTPAVDEGESCNDDVGRGTVTDGNEGVVAGGKQCERPAVDVIAVAAACADVAAGSADTGVDGSCPLGEDNASSEASAETDNADEAEAAPATAGGGEEEKGKAAAGAVDGAAKKRKTSKGKGGKEARGGGEGFTPAAAADAAVVVDTPEAADVAKAGGSGDAVAVSEANGSASSSSPPTSGVSGKKDARKGSGNKTSSDKKQQQQAAAAGKQKGGDGKGGVGASGKMEGAGGGAVDKSEPVFLFFSVHQSGQFCGAAQLLGPLDNAGRKGRTHQQEHWRSHFPVKWVFAKDIPNYQLRHITLPNNNNKPVAISKDAQEVPFEQGLQMLKTFHAHKHVTSIVDDFAFYENRAMQYQRSRQPQNNYGNLYGSQFTPQQHHYQHLMAQQQYQQYQQQQFMQAGGYGGGRNAGTSGVGAKKKKNKKSNNKSKRGGAKNSGGGSTAAASKESSTGDAGAASPEESKEASGKKEGDQAAPGADQAAGAAVPPSANTAKDKDSKHAPASGGAVTPAACDSVVGDGGKDKVAAGASAEGVPKDAAGMATKPEALASSKASLGTTA